ARVEPAVTLGDHHAFVGLHALARAFDDVDVDHHGVAGGEVGDLLVEPDDFFLLEDADQVHCGSPGDRARPPLDPVGCCCGGAAEDRKAADYMPRVFRYASSSASSSPWARACAIKSGRRCAVMRSDSWR